MPRLWLFDLDDTLHDASAAMFSAIDARMTDYLERHLEVDRAEANRLRRHYWHRYGATMLGLVRHHGVDPHHFLFHTHDFDVAAHVRAERGLTQVLDRLPGRKLLLTNAPGRYAATVLGELGLTASFARLVPVEGMRVHGAWRPKPSRSMLAALLAREGVPAAQTVLVEDNLANLKSAKSLGMRTVLVTGHRPCHGRPTYVDRRVAGVADLPRACAGWGGHGAASG